MRRRPIRRIVRADARAHRRRTLLVAGLLAISAVAPWLQGSLTVPAIVVAAAVAIAVSALVIESNEATLRVLDLNGASRTSRVRLAAGGVLTPGLIAITPALAAAIAVAAKEKPDATSVSGVALATVCLVVLIPVLTAIALGFAAAADDGHAKGWTRWVRIGVIVILVPIFPVGTAVAGGLAWVSRGRRQPTGRGLGLAVVAIVVVTVLLGSQSSWADANILSVLLLPVLAVAVARIATAVLVGVARGAGDRQPVARLATEPLLLRRAAYAPLVATAALVLTAVTTQAVLGASIGEREARRQRQLARYDDRVGLNDHQLIVQTALDAKDQRRLLVAAAQQWGERSVVMLRTAEMSSSPFDLFGAIPDGGALAATRGAMRGPRELAIVDPGNLRALGLQAHADDLRSGRALILNPALGSDRAVDVVDTNGRPSAPAVRIPAVRSSTTRIAHDLPGVLITSPMMTASLRDHIGTELESSHADHFPEVVTLVVDTGGVPTASDKAVATRLAEPTKPKPDRSEPNRPARRTPTTLSNRELASLFAFNSTSPTVRSGGTRVAADDGDGPLNDTAFAAARSWDASRGSVALGAAVALIILVIVAVLANGLSRDDDEIIELQGGSPGTRRRLSAIQAGVMGAAASIVAALVGIGAVGAGIALYNGSSRWGALGFQDPRPLPPIPFTVPWPVLAVLVTMPVLAAAASVAVTATARRPDPRSLASRVT